MAFVPSTLEAQLLSVFKSMTDGNEDTFPDGISNAVVSFVATGQVTTVDSGGVSAGAFTGSGSGSISATATECAGIIKTACLEMKNKTAGGDDYLAEQIGKGIKAMANNAKVTTTVTGVATAGTTTTPLSGSAKGTIKCSETALITGLKSCFKKMYTNRETIDGNAELAKELASQVNSFWTSGVVSTQGQGSLSGATGSGTVA